MNSRQRQRVLFEIYVPELSELPDSEAIPLREVFAQGDMLRNNRICDDLQKLTDMWVQKEMLKNSVVHAVLWEWVQCVPDTRREALIQTLRDLVVHFAHTAAGSKVAHYLVSQGTAKDRKLLIKSIKPNVVDLAIDEYGVWPLVRIVDCVDDTKLVSDAVLKPLLAGDVLGTLLTHRWASLVFLQVFSPTDKHYLAPDQLALMAPAMVKAAESKEMVSTSKKPMEVRQKELLEVLVGPLVNYYISEMNLANLEEDYGEDKPLNNKYSCNVLFELLALPSHDVTRAVRFQLSFFFSLSFSHTFLTGTL
jgi:pumilio family protein 6